MYIRLEFSDNFSENALLFTGCDANLYHAHKYILWGNAFCLLCFCLLEVGDNMRELSNVEKESIKVRIPIGPIYLNGNLDIPEGARGFVVFVHGSGSSRFSPRNQYVAQELQRDGLGTLLFDLLTEDEEGIDMITRNFRFDIDLLSKRLIDVTRWLLNRADTKES